MSDRPSDGFTLDELREEYDWTREFLNRIAEHCGTKDCPSLVAYVNKLEGENSKLRELVRHLRECTRHNVCVLCEYADVACDFDHDMRRLGMEVDA